jgi:phosphoglucosamine mutase
MRRRGAALGGEQSGHLIWSDHATTGDGLLSALMILAEMVSTERPLSVLRAPFHRFPQALVNVRVREKPPLGSLEPVAAAIASAESDLGDRGRVLVRYSGTEAKARVMVEAESEAETTRWSRAIAEALEGAIGLAEPEG